MPGVFDFKASFFQRKKGKKKKKQRKNKEKDYNLSPRGGLEIFFVA